ANGRANAHGLRCRQSDRRPSGAAGAGGRRHPGVRARRGPGRRDRRAGGVRPGRGDGAGGGLATGAGNGGGAGAGGRGGRRRPRGPAGGHMSGVLNRLLPALVLLIAMAVLGIAVGWLVRADLQLPDAIPVAVRADGDAAAGRRLVLAGGATDRVEATLEFELPGSEPGHWLLWLPRDPLETIVVEGSDADGRPWSAQLPGFFEPVEDDGFAPGGFAAVLPRGLIGSQTLKLTVQGGVRSAPTPRIVGLDVALRQTGNEMVFASAIYAAWATLLIATLALYAALRDPLFLLYAQYTTTALLFMATLNGHLYQIPWMGWL